MVRRPFIKVPENGTMDLSNSMPNLYQEHLMKMLFKPQVINNNDALLPVAQQEFASTRSPYHDIKSKHSQSIPNQPNALNIHSLFKNDQPDKFQPPANTDDHLPSGIVNDKPKLESETLPDNMFDLPSLEGCNIEKMVAANSLNTQSQLTYYNQNQSSWPMQPQLESSSVSNPQQLIDMSQSDPTIVNGMLPQLDIDEWMMYPSCQSQVVNPSIPSMNQDVWDHYVKNLKILSQGDQLTSNMCQPGMYSINGRDLSSESNNQSEICVDVSNSVNTTTMVDPSTTSSTFLDDFCTMKGRDFQQPQDCIVGNLSSSQDGQSQITSASLAESHAFSLRDNSGGTSSRQVDFDESSFLKNNNSWQQVAAPIRTYTKVCSGTISLNLHSYYKSYCYVM